MISSKYVTITLLFTCYLTATIFKSDLWGNILSPVFTFFTFLFIYNSYVMKQKNKIDHIIGFFLSLGILSWATADFLWAVYDLILKMNPDHVAIITYLYFFPNVFMTISITLYAFQVFRKWNIVQAMLDSLVLSYLFIELIWIVFLNEDVKRILILRSDWISTASMILDIIVIMWIIIWFISVRSGRNPLYIRCLAIGLLLYSGIDLIYYYSYFYKLYRPNSLIDAVYAMSFLLIAISGIIKIEQKNPGLEKETMNIGRKGRTLYLLFAPAILIIAKGFDVVSLLQFVSIILIYSMITTYVQNNIYKEGLLRKEKEINQELEQKVKIRTEELEESNQVLQNLIHQDYITGLYNRRYMLSYLEEAIANLNYDETIVLLYMDINRFKMIKTMFGHTQGEKILHDMAEKMKPVGQRVSKSILASYGDDTYIFVAIGQYDYKNGQEFAREMIHLCSDIYHIDDYQIRITVNIGISIFPYDAITKEDLVKHADIAMTQAREQGFNTIREFDFKLSETFMRKSTLEFMLKKVSFKNEFMVYYQPQLDTFTRKIIGFEALLRWKTPAGEFMPPSEFIPVAEETGFIIPIGEWVMKTVMYQLIDWNNYFNEKIMIGINVSLKQLNSAEFIEHLKEEIERLQVKPEWIDLEITESFQLAENPDMILMLEDIRSLGVRISIDDFGTGYSSLSYLKGLPVDRIKLAKELIDYIHTDDFDYQLVKSLIQLSKVRGIKVIAEGVETREQWETLKDLQCDEVQGYYFGRPVPPREIEATFGTALMKK